MASQYDSVDISQLKAFALDMPGNNNVSGVRKIDVSYLGKAGKLTPCTLQLHERAPPPSPATTNVYQPERPGNSNLIAKESSTTSVITDSQPLPGSVPQSRTTAPNAMIQQPLAQSSLPSIVPDSVKERMFVGNTQSDGDTQPVSPSVYDEYNSRSKRRRTSSELSDLDDNVIDPQENLPHTLQHGDTGHIDLLAEFERPLVEDVEEMEESDREGVDQLSQSQDVRADIFPESNRFQAPKTPASHGRKRKRAVDTSSQDQITPKLPINPFAGQVSNVDGMMGPSQLFQTTQALTSPMTNLVPSDGLSERPSPDMHNIQRPSTAGLLSSPAKVPYSGAPRAITEPQSVYVTMKESQEARERQLKLLQAQQALSPDELLDDQFADDTQLRRRLRQSEYNLAAKQQLAGISTLSRSTRHGNGHGQGQGHGSGVKATSTRRTGAQASEPILLSDEAEGNTSEEETEREDDIESEEDDVDELAEENKENVEVPRTVSRAHHTSQVVSSQPTPSRRRIRNAKIRSKTRKALEPGNGSQNPALQRLSSETGHESQPEVIVDSQSSQTRAQLQRDYLQCEKRAFSEPRSSLDSRILVPQSQPSEGIRLDLSADSKPHEYITKSSSQRTPSSSAQGSSPSRLSKSNSKRNGTKSFIRSTPPCKAADPQPSPKEGTNRLSMGTEGAMQQEGTPKQDPSNQPPVSTANTDIINTHASSGPSGELSAPDSTKPLLSPRTSPTATANAPFNHSIPEHSRGSTLFETAQEQPQDSPSKSPAKRSLRKSQSNQSSPRKSMRLQTIEEITAKPSPPDITGDVDIDINILSSDDIDFQNVLHPASPQTYSRKSRRGGQGQRIATARLESRVLPALPGTPQAPPSSAISKITPVKSSSPAFAKSPSTNATTVSRHSEKDLHDIRPPKPPIELHSSVAPGNEIRVAAAEQSREQHTSTDTEQPESTSISGRKGPPSTTAPRSMQTGNQQEPAGPSCDHVLMAPNRVFAHFNGSNSAYYPATCLEVIDDAETRYSVRFDDGTVDTISAYSVKRLELNIGDLVKVDLPGARTKTFVIDGMRDQQRPSAPPDPDTPSRRGKVHSTNDPAFPETDVFGHATVLVSPRLRTSIDGKTRSDDGQLAVPLTQIYLTQTLWTSFRNRMYDHIPNRLQSFTGLQTPSERPSTPSTPSSRARRMRTAVLAQSRSTASNINHASESLFKNMAFAITNVDRAEDSKRVKSSIQSNGGVILENGFHELFSVPTLNRTTSPKKSAESAFEITAAARDMGFTCLLADKHCRTAKFVQALALGIPCLATRWVTDCIAKQRILPWAPYLLPAGESKYLGGAVRSRTLQPFSASDAQLSGIVDNRSKLLDGDTVLLIMEKSQEETMKQHPLITHALGASKIARAVNEEAAIKAVADAGALGQPWDWVFSYDKEKEVERKLFGGGTTGKKRKRGRDSEVVDATVKKVKTKVVGNEFVIQSLILGMLVDE